MLFAVLANIDTPPPVFFKPFQWTDFLHTYLGGQGETKDHDILPGKLSYALPSPLFLEIFFPCIFLLVDFSPDILYFISDNAACGDLPLQYISPGGLFYVNICDKKGE